MSAPRLTLCLVLVLALLAPGASQSLAQPAASPAAPASAAAPGAMLIVENAGQWPAAARFQVWNSPLGPGTTWLAEDAIWLVVAGGKSQVADSEGPAGPLADMQPANLQPATLHALKLTFPGSNPDVRIEPFGAVDTTISYFIGNDPEQWRPDVPVWGGVRYVDLYPGVDLVFGGPDGDWRLEAEPSAATELVRVQVEGANVVVTDGAKVRLTAASELQSIRLPAAAFSYQVVGTSRLGFPAVAADPALADPHIAQPDDNPSALLYSTFLGGAGVDLGVAIAVDDSGSAYVAGTTASIDFPTTPGAYDPSYNGGTYDVLVAKLNSAGSGLVYATFLGGSTSDNGSGIALDGNGNAHVIGLTNSSNFPTTPGAFDPSYNGGMCGVSPSTYPCMDAFVVKLNHTGTSIVYGTFLGGNSDDWGFDVALDSAQNAYLLGWTTSSGFPSTPGAFDRSYNGSTDVFVAKLSPTGSELHFATYLGGSSEDGAYRIAVDGTGSAYVVGGTSSSDFPSTPGAFDPSHNGAYDAFVVRLNPAGNGPVYATLVGGSGSESGLSLAIDEGGNAYITGQTNSIDFPTTPGAYDPSYNGGTCGTPPNTYPCFDAFAVKLNPIGSSLVYATFFGGSATDDGTEIAVCGDGSVYVYGTTRSIDFPATPGAFDPSFNGGIDAFAARFDQTGAALDYSTFLGGSGNESATGAYMAMDGIGNTYLAGATTSADFPTTSGAFDPNFNGGVFDDYVAKLDTAPYMPNVLAPIEQPTAGAFVSGAVTLRGYAIDLASITGAGIDMVHIYLDGPYGTGTIIGAATYGLDRPDIAAQYGARFGPSGWELAWDTAGLTPGVHRLYLYAHRTTDNAWSAMEPHLVVVPGGPARWLPIVLRRQR